MADVHITRELLRAADRGELPPRLLLEIGAGHFALPPEQRADRIKRAHERFRSGALSELLIEESRKRIPSNPHEAFHLAELARIVIHRSPNVPGAFNLMALSTAYMANACRVSGDLRRAAEHFGHARYIITHEEVTDPEVLARVDELEGSLLKDQRLFDEAEEHLARAALFYRLAGLKIEGVRVTIILADVSFHRGNVSRAIEILQPALGQLHRVDDPRLFMCARYNLARYFVEVGQFWEASDIIATEADLFRQFPEPWTQLRVTWLRGKIFAGRNDLEAAEKAFSEVVKGFIAEGVGYDAAMVTVEDLAPLYLKTGRTADVKRLAEEMIPIFQAADVHREALAALLLFQEAARHETLTVKLARDVARYLKAARVNPSLRFSAEKPS
ncbi:MAG TPA: hypothetical protein VFE33_23640 [Thermoanaerobaculia bacterium]|nr:hypothetical protein [Thermoanaerobaculia bacterium]